MKRFKALDIFRGMTIAFMIVVNNPGDWSNTYSLLLHADWHGFTPTDLVFPSFLFAVGNAMAFVSLKWENQTSRQVLIKGLKRAFIIFILGYLLSWFPFFREVDGVWVFKSISYTRIFGVLQRIGLCYAVALPLVYYLTSKQIIYASGGLLFVYWLILPLFGDLSLEGNAVLKLDLWLIGPNHLYGGEGIPFDPEGLLSTIPAIVNVLGGYLVGVYLRKDGASYEKLAHLMLIGTALLFVSYIWDPAFPFNKKIWTSSFVLLTVGLDCLILGLILYLMEFAPRKFQFDFFNSFGKNPLFVYIASGLIARALYMIKIGDVSLKKILFDNLFAWMGGNLSSLAFAMFVTAICWGIAVWLEKRNIYIKV